MCVREHLHLLLSVGPDFLTTLPDTAMWVQYCLFKDFSLGQTRQVSWFFIRLVPSSLAGCLEESEKGPVLGWSSSRILPSCFWMSQPQDLIPALLMLSYCYWKGGGLRNSFLFSALHSARLQYLTWITVQMSKQGIQTCSYLPVSQGCEWSRKKMEWILSLQSENYFLIQTL